MDDDRVHQLSMMKQQLPKFDRRLGTHVDKCRQYEAFKDLARGEVAMIVLDLLSENLEATALEQFSTSLKSL